MKRKTVNSILKGVAGASLAFGGVSVLSDVNLVYAQDVDNLDGGNAADTNEEKENQSSEDESGFEAEREAYLASQPDDTCTMSTVADAMKKAAEEAQKAKEADAPANEDESEGGSVLAEDGTTQTPQEENAENQETDAESQEQKLAELKAKVDAAQKNVDGKVEAAQAANKKTDANYYRAADELTKAMIEYYAAQEGFDGTIEFNNGYCSNKWVSNGIDHNSNFKQNYLETTYKDASGKTIDIIYYDYVNADADGTILTDTKDQDNANLIDHIVVYEKAPVFAVEGGNGSFTFDKDGNFIGTNDSFTFECDECRNIIAYIIDGQKIEVKVDDNGERYIVDSEDEEGSVVATTVTGNNASGYTVTVTKTKSVTNAGGETEQVTTISEKLYKVLKGFSSGEKGKGEIYKKDLEPETPVYTYTGPTDTSTPEAPQPETPETEITDEDVPLSDGTDVFDEDMDLDDDDQDEELTVLEDEEVPLAVLDEDEPVDIPDEDVPLSDNPETGDAMTATWLGTAVASVAGLFGASRKKRKG